MLRLAIIIHLNENNVGKIISILEAMSLTNRSRRSNQNLRASQGSRQSISLRNKPSSYLYVY